MDEAAISLDPVLRKCWMKRGQQRRVPLPADTPPAQHLFAGYNWQNGTVSWQWAAGRDSEGFVRWLEHLMLHCYPSQQVVLVMDNASFHKSQAAQAAIALFEARLVALFLPPYSPNLNPIERYWRHLKDRVCANKLYSNLATLRDAVVKELSLQNDLSYTARLQLS